MPIAINGSGTVTGISVGGLPDGIVDRDTLAAQAKGSILQVVQAFKDDVFSTTSNSFVDITGLSASITPSSSSSKILVGTNIYVSTVNNVIKLNLVRGSTNIAQPSGSSNNATMHQYESSLNMATASMTFLDSPSTTSATTYKVMVSGTTGIQVVINEYTGSSYLGVSTLILMEVAA